MVPENKTVIIEQSFLCANQIIICLKFLEKTVRKEATSGCLITARQCFYERILWCLARLKSTVKSANDDVLTGIAEPENFISLLDVILDILSPFVAMGEESHLNKAAHRAELMIDSQEIRGCVERLLSHTMTFANIVVDSDKKPIRELAQNIYKAAIEFEEEFSLSQPGKKAIISSQQMKAVQLENSLYSLENYVNDSLLRLVFEVFPAKDGKMISNIRKVKNTEYLEREIEKFDLFVDRTIQIGHFAIWFSRDNKKIASAVRSCVASIESLDSYLIPALTSDSDPSIDVFEEHFLEEVKLMQNNVQQIIDTKAFCSSLVEQLNLGIKSNRDKFSVDSLKILLSRAHVLLQHLHINGKSLQISKDEAAKFYFGDMKLILEECEAIVNFPDPIDDFERRTIKRFKILCSTIVKLENVIQKSNPADKNLKPENVKLAEIAPKYNDYFNTIRPSAIGSILYESKRSIKFLSNSLDVTKFSINSIRKSTKRKRQSLRMAIFTKNSNFEKEEAWNDKENSECNESMDLQITQILDKITDLSTTLASKAKLN